MAEPTMGESPAVAYFRTHGVMPAEGIVTMGEVKTLCRDMGVRLKTMLATGRGVWTTVKGPSGEEYVELRPLGAELDDDRAVEAAAAVLRDYGMLEEADLLEGKAILRVTPESIDV